MKYSAFRKTVALLIGMLLMFSCCFAAFAEEPAPDNEPEEEVTYDLFSDEVTVHRLWGFFTAWAVDDPEWMLLNCAAEWKKEKADPGQALAEILKSGKPHGYRIGSISGEESDPVRIAEVILQRETEDGGYTWSLHRIRCLREAEGYVFDPEGLASGSPADAVPEEELFLMTREGVMKSRLEMHGVEGLYDRLVPIGVSIERLGIRVEIVSGLAEGTNAWFVISLQDTEGKYDGFDLEPMFTDNIDKTSFNYWCGKLYDDQAERKSTYIVCQELDREITPEDAAAAVGVTAIRVQEEKTVDLLPALKQYGGTAEGILPPKTVEHRETEDGPVIPEGFRVLDYNQPLDVRLFKGVDLTGIGWIGGQLHVQFHNRGHEYVEMRNGRSSACSVGAVASVYGRTYRETNVDYSPLLWDGDNDGWTDWSEYVFNCGPEEADQLELNASITITDRMLQDEWHLLIRPDQILAAPGA